MLAGFGGHSIEVVWKSRLDEMPWGVSVSRDRGPVTEP